MTPQPALKVDEIIALINELNLGISKPSPFELARLDAEIRKFGDADIAASQCFRGSYHALQGDLENTVKWFTMALSLAPDNSYVYMNYATMLNRLEQHEQAVNMALESVNKAGGTPESIDNLLVCAYCADNHAAIAAWLPEYEKLTGRPHKVALWLQEDAEDEAGIESLREESRKGASISLVQLRNELGL